MTFTLTLPIPYLVITLALLWGGVVWLAIEVYQTVRLSEVLQASITHQQAALVQLLGRHRA